MAARDVLHHDGQPRLVHAGPIRMVNQPVRQHLPVPAIGRRRQHDRLPAPGRVGVRRRDGRRDRLRGVRFGPPAVRSRFRRSAMAARPAIGKRLHRRPTCASGWRGRQMISQHFLRTRRRRRRVRTAPSAIADSAVTSLLRWRQNMAGEESAEVGRRAQELRGGGAGTPNFISRTKLGQQVSGCATSRTGECTASTPRAAWPTIDCGNERNCRDDSRARTRSRRLLSCQQIHRELNSQASLPTCGLMPCEFSYDVPQRFQPTWSFSKCRSRRWARARA